MSSIAQSLPQALDGPVTKYRYALHVTPADVQTMSREQLIQLVFEQATLLTIIFAIVYSAKTGLATRLVAIDLLFENVEKSIKQRIQTVLEKTPVLYAGVGRDQAGKRASTGRVGVAERLGMSGGTVSTAYSTMEEAGLVKLHYRTTEGHHKHVDVEMQEAFLYNPAAMRDKKEKRAEPIARKKEQALLECPKCGSENVDLYHSYICHDCHEVSHVEVRVSESPIVVESQPTDECHHDEIASSVPASSSFDDVPVEYHHDEIEPQAAASSEREVVLQALVPLMSSYHVKYEPHLTCTCGCKLWRYVAGLAEWECCRCDPHPLWPSKYDEVLHLLYPGRYRDKPPAVPKLGGG